jgi:HlyD family secretion protein
LRGGWLGSALLAFAVAAAAAYVFQDSVFGTRVEVREVSRGSIVETVVASGRVMTPQRVSIGVVTTEWVARIPVDQGQAVRKGDVLIELNDDDERAAVAQARALVAQAAAKVRQLREVALPAAQQALLQAQANLRVARQQYERNRDLKAKGFISDSALDDARRNLDISQSQLDAARLQVESNGPAGSDFTIATSALAHARASLVAAQTRLDQMVIRAPVDGTLISRNVEPGDAVQPGNELMALAPRGETQVVVQVDEKHLAQLELGQKALVSADAYPNERFAAVLFYINPGIDPLRGSVEVRLRVQDPPQYLRQDMTVSVDMEVARRTDTLVAPADTIFDPGTRPFVLAAIDHRAVKKLVTLGLKGEGKVEILHGVAAGDRLVGVASGVSSGQRVRVAGLSGRPQ